MIILNKIKKVMCVMSQNQFKIKPDKIKHKTEITSLDTEHKNFLNDLKNKKKIKIKNETKIELLKKKLDILDNQEVKDSEYINKRTELLLEIDALKEFIDNVEYDEKRYFTQSYDIVMSYYECGKKTCKLSSMNENVDDENNAMDSEQNKDEEIVEYQPTKLNTLQLLNLSVRKNKKEKKILLKGLFSKKINLKIYLII